MNLIDENKKQRKAAKCNSAGSNEVARQGENGNTGTMRMNNEKDPKNLNITL